ncbi:hypothetical protein MAR_025487 [Mya arenaria]|uniref:Uncharacterized protein n=1 Tax=Mya arenaria TaxID=6604 RepID=A0ABY7EQR7_MYAAR|nr:hypothetical protein MAR_025487 [Mya arenaria]
MLAEEGPRNASLYNHRYIGETSGTAPAEFTLFTTGYYYYKGNNRQIYNEAFDQAMATTRNCIDQSGYKAYRHLEDMLLKSVTGDASFHDDMEYIVPFYGCDINRTQAA